MICINIWPQNNKRHWNLYSPRLQINRMKMKIFFAVFILHFFYVELKAENSTSCGDWISFKDEKCFKILDGTLRTFAEAVKSCASLENEPTLPFIHTKEEQEFLSNFLFKTQKQVENFWIGGKFSGGKYQWLDNSDIGFTNWEVSPEMNADHCVQIEADARRLGKWIDEPCEKKNLVICQKMQTWSLARLQRTFLDSRKKLTDELDAAKQKLEESNKKITDQKNEFDAKIFTHKQEFDSLKQNVVPIGFIYAQLPNEKTPAEIWPWMKWTDVSATFAGVFFRVNGGQAAAFGSVQEDNAPRLDQVYTSRTDQVKINSKTYWMEDMPIHRTGWSNGIFTGADSGGSVYTQFKLSPGEVRPRNMAIRIWKRSS